MGGGKVGGGNVGGNLVDDRSLKAILFTFKEIINLNVNNSALSLSQ